MNSVNLIILLLKAAFYNAHNKNTGLDISEKKGVNVEQVYTGVMITSLEMAGISLTLVHLDDKRRFCLSKCNLNLSSCCFCFVLLLCKFNWMLYECSKDISHITFNS